MNDQGQGDTLPPPQLTPTQKRNLVTRANAAMNALPAQPGKSEVWMVLKPDGEDWKPVKNDAAGNANNEDRALRFVFPDSESANRKASTVSGSVVEGGWSPVPVDEFQVEEVVVKLVGGGVRTFSGDDYDAVFLTKAARDRFVKAYYASTLGGAALTMELASALTMTEPQGHERWSRTSKGV